MKGRSLPIGQPQSSILARVFFPPSSGLTPGSTGSRRAGALVGLVPSFPHCLSHLARLLLASAGCWLRQGGESEGKGKGYFYLVRAIIVPSSYRMPSLQSLIPVLAPPPPSCGNLLWVFQTVCVLPPWVVHWGSTLVSKATSLYGVSTVPNRLPRQQATVERGKQAWASLPTPGNQTPPPPYGSLSSETQMEYRWLFEEVLHECKTATDSCHKPQQGCAKPSLTVCFWKPGI